MSKTSDIQLQPSALSEQDSDNALHSTMAELMNARASRNNKSESENIRRRKLPFFLDVFLYPFNGSGLMMLGIFVFMPVIFELIALLLLSLGTLGVIIVVPLGMAFWLINWIIRLYIFWYFAECIRQSATGQVRAPEVIGAGDDGLGVTFRQMFHIICCMVVCFVGAIVYVSFYQRVDPVFWLLLGCGVFFLPMALLSTIMFDSLSGLNPIIIIGSIFSTFFKYIGVALAFYVPYAISVGIFTVLAPLMNSITVPIFSLIDLYLLLVAAHLLGWFFYRNEEKLNWEV